VKSFDTFKKELALLRESIVHARYLAFGQDELAMCNERIR
jgi:hypothetical protein